MYAFVIGMTVLTLVEMFICEVKVQGYKKIISTDFNSQYEQSSCLQGVVVVELVVSAELTFTTQPFLVTLWSVLKVR